MPAEAYEKSVAEKVLDLACFLSFLSCPNDACVLYPFRPRGSIRPQSDTCYCSASKLTSLGRHVVISRFSSSPREHHETYLPAFRREAQTHPRLPRAHADSRRASRDTSASRQGPISFGRLVRRAVACSGRNAATGCARSRGCANLKNIRLSSLSAAPSQALISNCSTLPIP